MTISAYISQKLQPFGTVSEAQLLDMSLSGGFNLDEEYSDGNAISVGVGMTSFIEELAFAPKLSSVNESGFSMSWDFSGLGKYYLWLCQKYGITPNSEVAELLGISAIIDKTDCW